MYRRLVPRKRIPQSSTALLLFPSCASSSIRRSQTAMRPEAAPIEEFRYLPDHVTRRRPTLSRGSSMSTCASPRSIVSQRGDPIVPS